MNKFIIDDSLGYIVSKTNAAMRGKFNRLITEQGLNATAEQWGILNIIKVTPGLTQKDISIRIDKEKTNVTRMIDVLEREGFLKRKSDQNDRRVFRIYLTETGEELIKKLIPIAEEVNKESSFGLNEKEIERLKLILKKIQKNIRKEE